jgi:hypothetical protein
MLLLLAPALVLVVVLTAREGVYWKEARRG